MTPYILVINLQFRVGCLAGTACLCSTWHQWELVECWGLKSSKGMLTFITDGWFWLLDKIFTVPCKFKPLCVAFPRGLGLLTAWWLGSKMTVSREKNSGGISMPILAPLHPFYHILLIGAVTILTQVQGKGE